MRINDHIHSNAYPSSYYAATINDRKGFSSLDGDQTVDVCIVGAGFTGIATALHLAEKGYKVSVVEQNLVGWGATGRNGGQVIGGYAHGLYEHGKMVKTFGKEGGDAVWDMGVEEVTIIKDWVEKYKIDCDLEWGYIDLAMQKSEMSDFEQRQEAMTKRGYPHETKIVGPENIDNYIKSDKYVGGLVNMGWGQVHPLNLAIGEARAAESLGAKIYENTMVTDIIHGPKPKVVTENGTITANQLVVTGNGYLRDLVPHLAARVLPAGSYIVATEPLSDEQVQMTMPTNYAACDQRWALDYFRMSSDNRMLFGGLCTYSGLHPKSIQKAIIPKMNKVFPHLKDIRIDYEWGGYLGIGLNRIPQIGKLSDNVFYATGYGGHGVAPTHMSAKLVAEAVAGQFERYDILATIKHSPFPGGRFLMKPAHTLGMLYYKMRDELGW